MAKDAIIEWFNAHMIARKKKPVPYCIPDGKGKHPPELLEAGFTPTAIRFKDYLGIRAAAKSGTSTFQFLAHLAEVINLSVVDDPVPAFLVLHRLMTERRQIKNGEPPIAESDFQRLARIIVNNDRARIVGPAVSERASGSL
ncbi:MAG: hypothetical protein NVS1B11_37660 [Terriglobales bacterium]